MRMHQQQQQHRYRHQQQQEGPKWQCIHCHCIMDRTNFTHFIKESDSDKNSVQEARVQYHTWRAVQDDIINDAGLMPEL